MKTWEQITSEKYFSPEFIDLTLANCPSTEVVTAMIFEQRIDKSSIPEGWYAYDVRHSDDDDAVLATLEKQVCVNFYATVLVDHPIDIPECGYIKIEDWGYRDWQDVAEENLLAADLDEDLIEYWENLLPICENIKNLREYGED